MMSKHGFSQACYLARLSTRMENSRAGLDPDRRARHARAILSFRKDGGGFAGRRGAADLYYTGFALRALHALGEIGPDLARDAASYVEGENARNIVDELSMLNACLLLKQDAPDAGRAFEFIARFRSQDGGYAKTAGGKSGSTYHTFLAALCHDLMKTAEMEEFAGRAMMKFPLYLDHLTLGVAELYARGFPPKVIHLIASHHGEGGPVAPSEKEAVILHFADSIDSYANTEAAPGLQTMSAEDFAKLLKGGAEVRIIIILLETV